ncbi:MAG: 1-deoxy-D-xylulose-5-phosphate reductoisomerase [Candidatus Marinimicrobia bacterium]|nr:1-deoxy-D-xylulose-5-phosphate reductoisomerase [Candidatus Neomarinimicrobiota bacterium]
MKRISILGSTGSVGTQTLSVINQNKDLFKVESLSCNQSADMLFEQVQQFMPQKIAINSIRADHPLKNFCKKNNIELIIGNNSSAILSQFKDIDLVVNSIVGTDGLLSTLNTIKNNIDLALSNKESLVLGGHLIMPLVKKNSSNLIPVDSEHSAIFQCLHGEQKSSVKKIILTGSGGPFLNKKINTFHSIEPSEALKHPNWEMGRKISIDSSTMMNKGLELVEAMWLFDKSKEDIEIVIHPESIIHSMVQFVDDSYKAHLGIPDMKIPIQYALSFPERIMSNYGSLNFAEIGKFTFLKPDYLRYPALELLTELITSGGNRIPIMSMANDLIVDQFLNEKILFTDIPNLLEKTVYEFGDNSSPSAEDLLTLNEQIKLYLV